MTAVIRHRMHIVHYIQVMNESCAIAIIKKHLSLIDTPIANVVQIHTPMIP